MTLCTGCSSNFPKLKADLCHLCNARRNSLGKDVEAWPMCLSCGSGYQFLTKSICGGCTPTPPAETNTERITTGDSQGKGIDPRLAYALNDSVNPRTHGKDGNVYVNPHSVGFTDDSETQNDEHLRRQAAHIQSLMSSKYSQHNQGRSSDTRVAKPRMKGVNVQHQRASCIINVTIQKVENRNKKKLAVTAHTPVLKKYPDFTLWTDVLGDIQDQLHRAYFEQFEHRIDSINDFELVYTQSKTRIEDIPEDGTIGDLWQRSIQQKGLLISDKNKERRVLELNALVNYPRPTAVNDLDSEIQTFARPRGRPRKRKITELVNDEYEPPSKSAKFPILPPTGSSAYTTVTRSVVQQKTYTVCKSTCCINQDGSLDWIESTDTLQVRVGITPFASGKTKHTYKMYIDNKVYAAKSFYNIGVDNQTISKEDNAHHLKDELSRQTVATRSLSQFKTAAKNRKVPIADMNIAKSFILTVSSGAETGCSWLVDRFLKITEERKFSGTQQAGSNNDLIGKCCDAFAHFGLHDSQQTWVFVDIQGIITPIIKDGKEQRSQELILFDLMAHSMDQNQGLGDNGIRGLKEFTRQHTCNDICKKLGLPALSILTLDEGDGYVDSGASTLSDNHVSRVELSENDGEDERDELANDRSSDAGDQSK